MQEQCQRIGETAGKIYHALEKGGKTFEALSKEIGSTENALFNQAIGWLCREGKLIFEKRGQSFLISVATSQSVCCQ